MTMLHATTPSQPRRGRPRRAVTPLDLYKIDVLEIVNDCVTDTVEMPPVAVTRRDPPPNDVWTYGEVSTYLRVSRATVKKLVRQGDLPAVRLYDRTLFRRADVEALVAQGGTQGGTR